MQTRINTKIRILPHLQNSKDRFLKINTIIINMSNKINCKTFMKIWQSRELTAKIFKDILMMSKEEETVMKIYFTENSQMKNKFILFKIILRMNRKQDKKLEMTTKQLYHL